MELINQTKTNFILGKSKDGELLTFKVNEVRSFEEDQCKTLLRYEGVNTVESLKSKVEKDFSKAKKATKKSD